MAGSKRGNSTNTLSRRTITAIILSCLLLSIITTVITVYNYTADPRETIENMKNGLKRFVGTAEQFDDITMLCFDHKGPKRTLDPYPNNV